MLNFVRMKVVLFQNTETIEWNQNLRTNLFSNKKFSSYTLQKENFIIKPGGKLAVEI